LIDERLAAEWQHVLVRMTADYVALDTVRLSQVSHVLQVHVIRHAIQQLAPGEETPYALLGRGVTFVADPSCVRSDLAGGLKMYREGTILYISRGEETLPADAWPQLPAKANSIPVALGKCIVLSEGWQFQAGSSQPVALDENVYQRSPDGFAVWLDAETLPEHMELRSAHPGERFKPLGLKGHSQKLSDFFVNVKMPARARGRWPLLCSGSSVLWVPGYRPAESVRLRPGTRWAVPFALSRGS
jgi:tRNA(Ile)-lysidine synthase